MVSNQFSFEAFWFQKYCIFCCNKKNINYIGIKRKVEKIYWGVGDTLSAALLLTACGGSSGNESGSGDEGSVLKETHWRLRVWGGNGIQEEGSLDKMISCIWDWTVPKDWEKVYTTYNTQNSSRFSRGKRPLMFLRWLHICILGSSQNGKISRSGCVASRG